MSERCCSEVIQYHHFPAALTERPQWVLWKYEERKARRTKVLYQPNDRQAASTRPSEWSSLAACQEARWACIGRWDGPHYDGVGYVFSPDDPFVGVDLDKCRGEEWATEIIKRFPTYTEVTPSLHGFHLIGLGAMPGGHGRRKGQIELYDRARFFTMTGMLAAGSTADPQPIQPLIDELLAAWQPPAPTRPPPVWTPTMETSEILRRALLAKNGEKVARLYRGDTSGYPSGSEADFALLELFIYYTQDPFQLDALFRGSGLYDASWDEKRGAETYGSWSIRKALARPSAYYRESDEVPRILSIRTEPHDD